MKMCAYLTLLYTTTWINRSDASVVTENENGTIFGGGNNCSEEIMRLTMEVENLTVKLNELQLESVKFSYLEQKINELEQKIMITGGKNLDK